MSASWENLWRYPGGAYHVPKTIFEELEDESIVVPEEWRYFPYRTIFDFECYFDQEKAQEWKDTEKLTWQSAHVSLSVSVCSKVPGYQAPMFCVTGRFRLTSWRVCAVPHQD